MKFAWLRSQILSGSARHWTLSAVREGMIPGTEAEAMVEAGITLRTRKDLSQSDLLIRLQLEGDETMKKLFSDLIFRGREHKARARVSFPERLAAYRCSIDGLWIERP